MIKINLLPQRRVKRVAVDTSTMSMALGIASLVAAAGLVWFTVDRKKRHDLNELKAANTELRRSIARQNKDLTGYDKLQAAWNEIQAHKEAIDRLMQTKVVPAHVLQELGKILTTAQKPTMTRDMTIKVGTTDASDPNKKYQEDWDPNHAWLSEFSDTAGVFRIEGGAQSESDVTQLAKRLAASVYFFDVTPAGGERVVDSVTGLNYYHFTITGKLAY